MFALSLVAAVAQHDLHDDARKHGGEKEVAIIVAHPVIATMRATQAFLPIIDLLIAVAVIAEPLTSAPAMIAINHRPLEVLRRRAVIPA